MIRTLPAAPGRRVYLALPIHSAAGVETPRMGGIFDAVLGIGGSLVSSIFGNKSESNQLKAQRQIAADQLNASIRMAQMQTDLGMKQVDAAVQTERIRAANELAALDSALNASLSSQRAQKQIAQQQLATSLAAQSQAGVLSLAESGLSQSASVSRSYPRAAAMTFVLVAGAAVWAMTRMRTGPGAPRRRRRRFGGKRGGASMSSSPAPFPSQPAYSGQESS
jgi:hypothetical protein